MMNSKIVCIFFIVGAALHPAQQRVQGAVIKQPTKTPWELYEALGASVFIKGFNGTWISDEELYYTHSGTLRKYNAATRTDTEFVASKLLKGKFTFSPDNTKILQLYAVEEVFRHSLVAKYDVFDIKTKTSTSIHGGQKLQHCTWSPQSNRLSYVYKNNVYIHNEDGTVTTATSDGVEGVIYNGVPDWVYEEEVLSSDSAMWWSPDGRKLAVGFFNDTEVKTFKYFIYGEEEPMGFQYPKEVNLKYPKPGTPNPVVALKIIDLSQKQQSTVTIKAPKDLVSLDHILQNVVWADNETVLITWLNRRQNVGSMQLCTVAGNCHEVKRFEEPGGWISMGTPKCLQKSRNCIFTYWIDNWYQAWNLNLKSGENIWKSRGNFTVKRIYGYDEDRNKLYYQATVPGDPSVYHVFSNDECLTCNLTDVDGALCKSATASFSKKYSYYTAICNGPNPSYSKMFDTLTNTEIILWESNSHFRNMLEKKLRPNIEYLKVPLADGSFGFAKLQLPPNMDQTKKYPMIVNVYGGPDSVRVTNNFAVGFDAFATTKREVIYAQIDGRGTGNKGKRLLFSVNNNLGAHEVEDQIYVTKYLQSRFPYIDAERIGIWGWSYGGYMTARTLASDDERVFQCGISVAPVTSWLYYDTIYTERYMGLPTADDNLRKYVESSVLHNVTNFRNHEFLLIHGSADDNVHPQQSLMLAKVLEEQQILFEEMTYTDENHSIGNLLPHLYNTMDHFWMNCLNLNIEEELY